MREESAADPKLRILHLYPKADYYTGAAIQLYELASALVGRGHTVVVATRPSELWSLKCRGAGIVHCAVPMRSELDPRSVRDLVRIVRAHEIDIVHAHKGKGRTLAVVAGLVESIPALVLNRGVSFPLDRWNRLGYVTGAVTTIVAVSESIRDGLVRQGVPAGKIEVIYSGTDTTRFHPGLQGQALRGELGLAPDDFLVTQIGIRSRKGNDDVLTRAAYHPPVHHRWTVCLREESRPSRDLSHRTWRDRARGERAWAYRRPGRPHRNQPDNDLPRGGRASTAVRPGVPRILSRRRALDAAVETGTIRASRAVRVGCTAFGMPGHAECDPAGLRGRDERISAPPVRLSIEVIETAFRGET